MSAKPTLLSAKTAIAAMLYGAAALGASPAAADLRADQIAALKEMRTGDMKKLVIHDEPWALLETQFETGSGAAKHLDDFAGKVMVVNFWAIWCPPCIKEMPALDRLRGAMKSDDFDVIAISMDRASTDKIKDFYAFVPQPEGGSYRMEHLDIYREPTLRIGAEGGIRGMPITLILDREGREIARLQGDAEWDAPEAQEMMRAIIAAVDGAES